MSDKAPAVKHASTPPHCPSRDISDAALAWVVRLHSGEATGDDRRAYEAWRGQSVEHEAAALEAETLWSDAAHLRRDRRTGLVYPGRDTAMLSRRRLLTGAAGIAVLGGGLTASRPWLRSLGSDYATDTAETRSIDLPDGSRVVLNARSAMDVNFDERARRVVLKEGQAFFDVAAEARPFRVASGGVVVTALGTAFDVDANTADGSLGVAVTRHSVRVQPTAGGFAGVTVAEGQRVSVARNGVVGAPVAQDPAIALAWQSGMYVAENRRLDDIVAALSRYHGGWIVFSHDSLKSTRVSAVLDLRTPDASLAALASGLPIRVTRMTRFMTLISAA
ncbi:FecR family protein [Ensifer adhaerens]|uniref:FecR family protein n=1 Tax=Ensifer adhaerens TaxID=106592 RepID=UPI000CF16319|nr:FecR domain-containing protein [Ensifer adhaerens]